MKPLLSCAPFSCLLAGLLALGGGARGQAPEPHPPIAAPFTLAQPGFVTLVIKDAQGKRVRNLVSETAFPAGPNTAYWNGLDDLGRDPDAARHGVYDVPGRLAPPGRYSVRGLVRPAITARYEMMPYTHGDPGLDPPPGPYTFGSETGAGRLQYFPKLDQVWAYSVGMAYRVQGFAHGRVVGESRASGTVALDKIYEQEGEKRARQAAPLQIVPVMGDPLAEASIWDAVPTCTLRRNGADLTTVQVGYDAQNLYARLHIADDTPLQNAADRVNTAFKGGATRLMAALIGDRPHPVAMQAVTSGAKNPEDYYTPSAGHARFDFAGDVPGVSLADAEVRLSGQGQQGPQPAARCCLFTPQRPETSMTSDASTEARLYPQS